MVVVGFVFVSLIGRRLALCHTYVITRGCCAYITSGGDSNFLHHREATTHVTLHSPYTTPEIITQNEKNGKTLKFKRLKFLKFY